MNHHSRDRPLTVNGYGKLKKKIKCQKNKLWRKKL